MNDNIVSTILPTAGAIRFGDSLCLAECQELVRSLTCCALPFQCAHGRSVLLTYIYSLQPVMDTLCRPSLVPLIDLHLLRRQFPGLVSSTPLICGTLHPLHDIYTVYSFSSAGRTANSYQIEWLKELSYLIAVIIYPNRVAERTDRYSFSCVTSIIPSSCLLSHVQYISQYKIGASIISNVIRFSCGLCLATSL